MKVWIPSLLYTSKNFKEFTEFKEFVQENEIQIIIDLREREPWFTDKIKNVEVIHKYIKPGETLLDVGRAIKDKHITMKKFCQKIVYEYLLDKKMAVLIICNDGFHTAGYIALVCRYWYYLQKGEVTSHDFIKENREKDFRSCKSKYQVEQAGAIAEYARKIVGWKGFSSNQAKPTGLSLV